MEKPGKQINLQSYGMRVDVYIFHNLSLERA